MCADGWSVGRARRAWRPQAAAQRGARRIFAVDVNPTKFAAATALGATDCVDPTAHGDKPVQQVLVEAGPRWCDLRSSSSSILLLLRSREWP